jgi:succinate dehydrogenase/fumarate reductase flavoprotein subunit
MAAALAASIRGLSPLVCEKTEQVGGTTATSAGTVWIALTPAALQQGLDSRENVERYLAALIPGAADSAALRAFLDNGPRALAFFAEHSEVKFTLVPKHPDYRERSPGATQGGRALIPPVFDGRLLGAEFGRVRPPLREFMVLGGMMLGKTDIPPLLRPLGSFANLVHATRLLARYALDRARFARGTRLVMGNALVGRLFHSLRQRNVPIRYGATLRDLIIAEGRVVGAVADTSEGERRIEARHGVVLASGGFGGNQALRAKLFPQPLAKATVGFEGNTAEAIHAALRVGAVLDLDHETPTFWVPTSLMRRADGSIARYPHIILDRAKPGLIAVDHSAQRFTNEADSYHDFVLAMYANERKRKTIPAHLICDAAFLRQYGLGIVHPGERNLKPFIVAGYLKTGATIEALGRALGIDGAALAATIARYNEHAARGEDPQFQRGATELNRFNGDPDQKPNPCVRPIGKGPYHAVSVYPSDLSTSVGLRADEHARVLDGRGTPIVGLYACGADMSSVMKGAYPGPGTTLGPAITFAYIAAEHLARHAAQSAPRTRSVERDHAAPADATLDHAFAVRQ